VRSESMTQRFQEKTPLFVINMEKQSLRTLRANLEHGLTIMKISKHILRQGDKIMIGGTELVYLDTSRDSGESEYDLHECQQE